MKKFLLTFFAAILCAESMTVNLHAEEVTVADGLSTNTTIPLYGAFVDEYIHTQIIYPAASLTALAGKSLTF